MELRFQKKTPDPFVSHVRALLHQVADTVRPLNPAEISIDTSKYNAFFSVEQIQVGPTEQYLTLKLKRHDRYPLSEDDLYRLWNDGKSTDLVKHLTLEALARGYVRCELFDTETNFVTFQFLRVQDLRTMDTLELLLPLPEYVRIGKLILTY